MEDIAASLQALRRRLEARAASLAEEVSRYPSPIARCDDQLPGLIEARSRAMALAREAAELEREKPRVSEAQWRARVARLLADAERLR